MAEERTLLSNYSPATEKSKDNSLPSFVSKSEEEVWDEFLNGSETALTFIYRQYAHRLYNYARQFTQNETLVEDCIQDLFYQLIKSRSRLGKTTSIQFYLYSSLRRLLTRKLKKDKRLPKVALSSEDRQFQISLTKGKASPFDPFKSQQINLIEKACNQLPERQREALLLLYYEGLSYQEIAETMHIGQVKSARTLVYRAIESLRRSLHSLKEDLISIAFVYSILANLL